MIPSKFKFDRRRTLARKRPRLPLAFDITCLYSSCQPQVLQVIVGRELIGASCEEFRVNGVHGGQVTVALQPQHVDGDHLVRNVV